MNRTKLIQNRIQSFFQNVTEIKLLFCTSLVISILQIAKCLKFNLSTAISNVTVSEDVPMLHEVTRAIRRLKNGRAAGADGITAELLKGAEKPISEALQSSPMCGPREEFQLNGKKALLSHSTRAKDRNLSAVATGRFPFCLYQEKYLHISFWHALSLYLTSAADRNSLVLLPVGLLGCHISPEIAGRVTPTFQ